MSTSQSRNKKTSDDKSRVGIIEAITAPLGFFVLALLIVESFLATVLLGAGLSSCQEMECVWIGIGLFIFVVSMVGFFVWYKPLHLTFDSRAHLLDRGRLPYGTSVDKLSASDALGAQKKEESNR